MKLKHKSLLYDISNMAYVIADCCPSDKHSLHQVRDVCQEGNIDRVSRILGLAYSHVLAVLSPVLHPDCRLDPDKDYSAEPHDYKFIFSGNSELRYALSAEIKLCIKETVHEYMVCLVLADWLGITLPEAADVWKFRVEKAMESLKGIVAEVNHASLGGFTRKISPF